MRFSHKFITFLFVSLVLLIIGNIASIVHFAPKYFSLYVDEIQESFPNDEYALISAFIESKNLDAATTEEYRKTLEDLQSLTKTLESYVSTVPQKNLTQFESLQKIGFAPETIQEVFFVKSVDSFLRNIVSIAMSKDESPEQKFLIRMLSMLFFVNIGLIFVILAITYVWTRIIFRPTIELSERITRLADERDYAEIDYRASDEFAPLVSAVNTLSANLARQEKIRSDFLSDFSHEIKTPITALKMFLEGVEDKVVKLDDRGMGIVKGEIERLISTTDLIMEYERIVGTEHPVAKRSSFDLFTVLASLREEYVPALRKVGSSIEIDLQKSFSVLLEKDLIIQMIHNVYSNFLKYAGENTVLVVRAVRRQNKVTLHFDDNGRGVGRAHVPYLHEKFYQEDSSRSGRGNRGIGIGLSLVDKIAKIHGGHMEISSDDGKGFHLKIVVSE